MTQRALESKRRQVREGRVVSAKMQKTVVVQVEQRRLHPLYGKVVSYTRRFKAHNEEPHAQLGDLVRIVESRPLSRDKCWRVVSILQRGQVVEKAVDVELESLREKEEAERAARRAEEERRAAERLAKLAGEGEEAAAEAVPMEPLAPESAPMTGVDEGEAG